MLLCLTSTMNKFNISLSIIFIWSILALPAQNPYYTIESFQDEYTELEEYNSMAIETGGAPTWDKRFELDFSFPFFDTSYTYMDCDASAVCYFDGSENFNIHLLAFDYEMDRVTNLDSISSDLRYAQLEKEGLKALVLQYTKIRLSTDPSIEEHDSYVNFQTWFFENGDMEIRFGDFNLDNSPNYVPGTGFYLFVNEGDSVLAGPNIILIHPDSVDDYNGLEVGGPYDSLKIYNNEWGALPLTTIPPSGWVIRFHKKALTKAKNELFDKNISIYPNPADEKIFINSDLPVKLDEIQILSLDGDIIKEYTDRFDEHIDISELPSGMYFIKFVKNDSTITKKIIKL